MADSGWSGHDRQRNANRIPSFCPKCRKLNLLPSDTRFGEMVKCVECAGEYAVDGFNTPSMLARRRLRGLLMTLAVVLVVVLGVYVAAQQLGWGGGAQPEVTDSRISVEGGRIIFNYTIQNRGARGMVEIRPRYWDTDREWRDLSPTTGSEIITMKAGEVREFFGDAKPPDGVWPMGLQVDCWPYRLGKRSR